MSEQDRDFASTPTPSIAPLQNDAAVTLPPPPPPLEPPSASSSEVRVEHVSHFRDYEPRDHHHEMRFDDRDRPFENVTLYGAGSPGVGGRDDKWSCLIVVLTFWMFVSMTVIAGVYGTVTIQLGLSSSILLKPNLMLVQSIKVDEERYGMIGGLVLYGFYDTPALDVEKTWSQMLHSNVRAYSHKDWIYFLNEGSQINVSYTVKSPSTSVFLVIAEGSEGLAEWLEDPSFPNTTLSWNVVHGSGVIQQDIFKSSNYYVAIGNLNYEDVEVQLNIRARANLYNTTGSYYKCAFRNGQCILNILFPRGNSAVITSPSPDEGTSREEWCVTVSYGPRWIMYIVGIGGMTSLMLLAYNVFNKFQHTQDEGTESGDRQSERAPLLQNKDDDLTSCDSYDSISPDEDDLKNSAAAGSLDGKPSKDGENSNNTRRLCAICFDAPRDCFFLPCGHCVACYGCGLRIAEASGTCPICRGKMKKVRKIFTV